MKELTYQILSLYLGQPCTTEWSNGEVVVERISTVTLGNFYWELVKVTPHLRHLASLTEEEAKILYNLRYGAGWKELYGEDYEPEIDSYLEEFWNDELESTQTERQFAIGHPLVWIKLLEWGFDLFRGIENGWAKERK